MKSVLISIQPKWCELIASGKKTVEVRKTKPKIDVPFKCYIYCTKDKKNTFFTKQVFNGEKGEWAIPRVGNGEVIGEFVCDRIDELAPINRADENIEKQSCLSREQIVEYLRGKGYGWHITDLVIYDKPKELGEFKKPCNHKNDCCTCDRYDYIGHKCYDEITRPPQSYMFVELEG